MRTSRARAAAAATLALVLGLALSGCSVIEVGSHVGAAASAAEKLGKDLKARSGVVYSSVSYDPTAPEGETLRVRVRLKPEATDVEWLQVLNRSREALTTDPLKQTVQQVEVSQPGGSGPRFVPGQNVSWPTTQTVAAMLSSWRQIEAATELHLGVDLAGSSSPIRYRVSSPSESARFMSGSVTMPDDIELLGYGFDTTSLPDPEARNLYQELSRHLRPFDSGGAGTPPSMTSFMVGLAPAGHTASIIASKTDPGRPAESDASLAALLAVTTSSSDLSVAWIGASRTAWVSFGPCPSETHRAATSDDTSFAALITATGYAIPASGGPGECLP